MKELRPEGWPRPKGYANGWRVPAGHDLVFAAGLVGWNADEQVVSDRFDAQFEKALENVLAVVREAGGQACDLVRLTVYVADLEAYRAARPSLGVTWKRLVGRHYPAMTLVEVSGLLEDGALVEIEATAAVPPARG